ncbi:flagellar hook-basal body complex protein [Marinilactibacillus sp. Marseille-P9653]|uniref:flagellar hook-basal body complex protein n=1 Tax=Marinilactibacillus sp. Marseille-P9653 TaxID=2866583 RepID=UPI001CE45713|nr:flagellar hook-basal body complex protein [Marinilactibacillus sp. Marseille-P9653]
MLKSLYSGITGMKGQQTKMDVISNNIANVNTMGFKSQKVTFQDMISQTNASAQGPNANGRGGINAQQVGLGTQVASTGMLMQGGSLQYSGRSLDFAIQNGDNSFFMVSENGVPTDANGNRSGDAQVNYTRDGNFYLDNSGNLTTANGYKVMGYVAPANTTEAAYNQIEDFENTPKDEIRINQTMGDLTLQDYNIDNTGTIKATYSDGNTYVLGRLALTNFTNPDGLEKTGNNMYNATSNSGAPLAGAPGEDGYGLVRSGFNEMSNVDLASEFTEMIVTSRAYQANSRSITTSDEMLQELINLKR